ncbi:MAG: DHH family phosphoesterase [Promethearchaeota archaeon]
MSSVLKTGRVCLFSHGNMDPDAIGSIAGMIDFITGQASIPVNFTVFDSKVSKLSSTLLGTLIPDFNFVSHLPASSFVAVLVDAQAVPRVDPPDSSILESMAPEMFVLDHHEVNAGYKGGSGSGAGRSIIEVDSRSNCEIVFKLFESAGARPSIEAAHALCAGILFDTGFLTRGSNQSISIMSRLLSLGVDIDRVRSFLRHRLDIPERIARLKGASRCEITRISDTLLVHTRVSSFEASACRALNSIGADISLCLSENKNSVRISARQTGDCFKKHGINLASVMESISSVIGGSGGGHSMAAAASGTGNGMQGLDQALIRIKRILKDGLDSVLDDEVQMG